MNISPRVSPAAIVMLAGFLSVVAFSGSAIAADLCHGKRATYVGTPGRDRIGYFDTSVQGRNPVLVMKGGDDVVDYGMGDGRLTICAGPGDDSVQLGDGSSGKFLLVDAGPGNDFVDPAGSTDEVQLPPMKLLGGPGKDLLAGGNGSDKIVGGGGADSLFGYWGDDLLEGRSGRDSADGGGDRDHCLSAENVASCERLVRNRSVS